jgi:hypothetical protein
MFRIPKASGQTGSGMESPGGPSMLWEVRPFKAGRNVGIFGRTAHTLKILRLNNLRVMGKNNMKTQRSALKIMKRLASVVFA